jgi:hypothetical protein
VTPALFSVDPLELLADVESILGLAPFVGPLPASFVDATPAVGPLPASAFGCANAGPDRLNAIAHISKLLLNEITGTSSKDGWLPSQPERPHEGSFIALLFPQQKGRPERRPAVLRVTDFSVKNRRGWHGGGVHKPRRLLLDPYFGSRGSNCGRRLM